jgi:hypothetical protein
VGNYGRTRRDTIDEPESHQLGDQRRDAFVKIGSASGYDRDFPAGLLGIDDRIDSLPHLDANGLIKGLL